MSAQFSALNLRPLLRDGQKGLFYLSLTGRRDADSVSKENRFVLMTDLGLIHKTSAQGGSVVYAVSLADGKPRGNVNVQVIGANGLPVFSARTDARGKAVLPSLAGFTREKKPLALAAARERSGLPAPGAICTQAQLFALRRGRQPAFRPRAQRLSVQPARHVPSR